MSAHADLVVKSETHYLFILFLSTIAAIGEGGGLAQRDREVHIRCGRDVPLDDLSAKLVQIKILTVEELHDEQSEQRKLIRAHQLPALFVPPP